jgi:hypothetical protein
MFWWYLIRKLFQQHALRNYLKTVLIKPNCIPISLVGGHHHRGVNNIVKYFWAYICYVIFWMKSYISVRGQWKPICNFFTIQVHGHQFKNSCSEVFHRWHSCNWRILLSGMCRHVARKKDFNLWNYYNRLRFQNRRCRPCIPPNIHKCLPETAPQPEGNIHHYECYKNLNKSHRFGFI